MCYKTKALKYVSTNKQKDSKPPSQTSPAYPVHPKTQYKPLCRSIPAIQILTVHRHMGSILLIRILGTYFIVFMSTTLHIHIDSERSANPVTHAF